VAQQEAQEPLVTRREATRAQQKAPARGSGGATEGVGAARGVAEGTKAASGATNGTGTTGGARGHAWRN
jgi:hypothetical protein